MARYAGLINYPFMCRVAAAAAARFHSQHQQQQQSPGLVDSCRESYSSSEWARHWFLWMERLVLGRRIRIIERIFHRKRDWPKSKIRKILRSSAPHSSGVLYLAQHDITSNCRQGEWTIQQRRTVLDRCAAGKPEFHQHFRPSHSNYRLHLFSLKNRGLFGQLIPVACLVPGGSRAVHKPKEQMHNLCIRIRWAEARHGLL